MVTLLLFYFLLTTVTYYVVGITPQISWVIFIVPLVIFFVLKPLNPFSSLKSKKYSVTSPLYYFGVLPTLVLDGVLFSFLFLHRTDNLLVSPWQTLPTLFFILFTVSTFSLFFSILAQWTNRGFLLTFVCSIHLFLMFSVAAIIYKLGFGFDAFVHRATELWIQTHGFILPKTPYYIGQYSFVVWLSNLTSIPIFYIDVYLVPILAAMTLPVVIPQSLERGHLLLFLIPFVPFLSLHLTTPYNLAFLFTVLCIFTLLSSLSDASSRRFPILLSVSAFITHPLIGAPLMLCVGMTLLAKRYKRHFYLILFLTILAVSLLVPTLFTLQNLRIHASLPTLSNPLIHTGEFLTLFARPYWYAVSSPIRFELLYAWQRLIVPIAILGSIVGFFLLQKKKCEPLLWFFPCMAIALFISAWFLVSWIHFPEVVAYEQGDYPLRLVKTSFLFLLPFGMYALKEWLGQIKKTLPKNTAVALIAACLLTLSLYLSYPQRNIKARFPGYNVTAANVHAVEWIHDRHDSYDYIVLSDQLVSAAALTKYSFAKYFDTPTGQMFYYSIPTGGLLYEQFGNMIYRGQRRDSMTRAMELAGVETGYFVVTPYWANASAIIEGAKKTADSWEMIDDGGVWIFVYKK